MNKACFPNKATILLWHATTALLGGGHCVQDLPGMNASQLGAAAFLDPQFVCKSSHRPGTFQVPTAHNWVVLVHGRSSIVCLTHTLRHPLGMSFRADLRQTTGGTHNGNDKSGVLLGVCALSVNSGFNPYINISSPFSTALPTWGPKHLELQQGIF